MNYFNNKNELERFIKSMIKANTLYKFYKTKEWLYLKNKIQNEYHNECVDCRKLGKITPCDVVHHEQYVRKYPRLALNEYYIDKKGNKKPNLIPLCNACHLKRHDYHNNNKSSNKLKNSEKW